MKEETKTLMEDELQMMIVKLENLKPGSEEHQKLSQDIKTLASSLNEANNVEADAYDREEKRRIDEMKNQKLEEIEKQKLQVSMIKMMVEGAIAIGITIYEWHQHKDELDVIGKFEETGRWVSTAFHNIKKPKIRR